MSELTNPIEQHQTPYDTGDRMEPRPWITHQVVEQLRAGCVPLNAEALDHFGRVDFDDDEGTTIVTIYVEKTLIGYMVHIDHLGDPTMLGVTIHQD